jgi:hypothetical protein
MWSCIYPKSDYKSDFNFRMSAYVLFLNTGHFCCFTIFSDRQSDNVANSIWKEITITDWNAQYGVLNKVPSLDVAGDSISWIDRP